jgi:hypothetical protein
MSFMQLVIVIILGLFLLYLGFRLAGAGWYKSKKDIFKKS